MTIPLRSEVDEANTWNLNPIYSSWDAWKTDYETLEARLPELREFRDTLADSASRIKEAFECYLGQGRVLEKLYVFAHLNADTDTGNAEHQGFLQQVINLHARLASEASYLTPELLAIETETLNRYLEAPELAEYKRKLQEIVRYKPHTLSQEEENLLANGLEVFGSAQKIFSQLNNADLSFGTILVDGEEKPLSHSTFVVFLKDQDRELRKRAFEQYYQVFDDHRNTIAASLTASVKKDVYFGKVRNFSSSLDRALFGDNVTAEVYDQLIESVSSNLAPLHRYYELRRKQLKLETSHLYDTYVPLVSDTNVRYTYEEAAAVICDSLAPLGEEYVDTLRAGLTDDRWVDRYENKGKRSGGYQSGCYDGPPYILMNYKEDELGDVFTLAHEAGHAMHTHYSCKNQAYQDHGYTIFVAEVASTFNEQLLMRTLKERHTDNTKMRTFLVNQQIDDIKATFFRQTMFAEFEKIIHGRAESNSPLTVDAFREVYRELLGKCFGPSLSFGEQDDLECLRIPHFYSSFYVYKYATGLAAAISLSKNVLDNGEPARERYLRFLSSGCSKYPLELLQDAGVDLSASAPVTTTIALFESLVSELDELLE